MVAQSRVDRTADVGLEHREDAGFSVFNVGLRELLLRIVGDQIAGVDGERGRGLGVASSRQGSDRLES